MIPENSLSLRPDSSEYLYPDDQDILDNQDWEFGGIAISDPSQGLEVQAWFSTYENNKIILHPTQFGEPVEIFTQENIIQHSFTFDQNMRWVLTYTLDTGVVHHVWYDTEEEDYVNTVYDTGEQSPRVCLDDKREFAVQGGTSDHLLFYVRNGTLYVRNQRERFETEHELIGGLDPATLLKNVGMAKKLRVQWSLVGPIYVAPPPGPVPPPPSEPVFTVLSSSLPTGIVGNSYSVTLGAKNGDGTVTWRVVNGAIPQGLYIENNQILGTPTTAGRYSFFLEAKDSAGEITTRRVTMAVYSTTDLVVIGTMYPYAPTSMESTGPTRYRHVYYGMLNLSGGVPPYKVQLVSGTLPIGAQLRTGILSGSLKAYLFLSTVSLVEATARFTIEQTYSFTLRIVDSTGAYKETTQFLTLPRDLYISSSTPEAIFSPVGSAPTVEVEYGESIDYTFTIGGGVGSVNIEQSDLWEVSGLTFEVVGDRQFRIHGTPTVTDPDPTEELYQIAAECEDSRGGQGGNAFFEAIVNIKFT